MVKAVHVPLAAATRHIVHENRRVEAGGGAAHLSLDLQRISHAGAQFLDPLDHIVLINVIGLHVQVRKLLDQQGHGLGRVVDPPDQNALVPYPHRPSIKKVHGFAGDVGDLVGAVEVGMEAYLLALDASLVDHIHQGSRPLLVGQDFHGHHRGAAAGEADSLYVRYVQQPPGYLPEIISCQAEGVAAGNHHVLNRRIRFQIVKYVVPIDAVAGVLVLDDGGGIAADRVAPGTETAIDGTDLNWQEQGFVRVAVDQARM